MSTLKVTEITLEQLKNDKSAFNLVCKHLNIASIDFFRSWGLNTIEGVHGTTPKDVVSQVIMGVFEPRFKFDPSRGNFYKYLKLSQLRGKIANLAESKPAKSRVTYYEGEDYDLNDSITFEDENRAEFMLNSIAECLENNVLAYAIVLAQYEGLKRKEIMDQEKINESEYAAAYRKVSKCREVMSRKNTK